VVGGEHIVSTVVPKNPRPIFKPREIGASDMKHWHIEAEWGDGTIEEIGKFKSIAEAWDWIARQSHSWLDERGCWGVTVAGKSCRPMDATTIELRGTHPSTRST
jgi:hypothetical protein